jgi:hypothetical protein
VQFLADGKPLATTCSGMPVELEDGELGLLLVAVDPVPTEIVEAAGDLAPDPLIETLFPPGSDYLTVRDGEVTGGSIHALATYRPEVERVGMPEDGSAVTRLDAGADGSVLLVYPPPAIFVPPIDAVRAEEGERRAQSDAEPEADLASTPEPMLPLGIAPITADDRPASATQPADEWVEPMPPPRDRALSSLFDRLADDATLYATLTADDEVLRVPDVPAPAAADEPGGTPEIAGADPTAEPVEEPKAGEPVEAAPLEPAA